MAEWQDISRRLSQTPGVDDIDVAGLSARGARMSLRFPGGAPALVDALAEQGLALKRQDGGWVLAVK